MNRYDRQIRVKQIGQQGQNKISQATILIIGAGGLGSNAAVQLARAGIKKIIIVDPDYVTLTNLHRQALFTEKDAMDKKMKVLAVKDHLQKINSETKIVAIAEEFSEKIIQKYNFTLCLDCTDNFLTRNLINKLAIKYNFDYIYASCAGTYGTVMPISPRNYPCLNCLFPDMTKIKPIGSGNIGVMNSVIPTISGIQISLVLHYLIDKKSLDFQHLITYDCWNMEQNRLKINKNKQCPSCSIIKEGN